jgi:two-component system response regulator YesN
VDDEQVICTGLKTLTEHLDLAEISSVETTTDPVEALAAIRARPPEIVMTDIKMPTISGLELMEQARSIAPSIRFVVISGHDDFALVRQALKQRATDYLLKPATTEELHGALTRTISAVLEQEERNRVPRALVAETIDRIAHNEPPDASRLEVMASSVRDVLPGPYAQLGILEAEAEHVDPRPDRVFELVRRELTRTDLEMVHVSLAETTSCVLISGASEARLAEVAARVARISEAATKGREVFSLSSISTSLELLPVLYREAYAARTRKLLEPCSLLRHADRPSRPELPSGARVELEELETLLSAHDEVGAAAWLRRLHDTTWLSVGYLERVRDLVAGYVAEPLDPIERFFSLDRLRDTLTRALLGTRDAGGSDAPGGRPVSGGEEALIAEAKRFVLSDLAHHADLSAVASHVGLSYSYFSTVFKEHADVQFSDFVRDARMTEARRLLASRRMSVGEVARRVGYQHAKHFSRAFKHYYGVTPRAYALSIRTGSNAASSIVGGTHAAT